MQSSGCAKQESGDARREVAVNFYHRAGYMQVDNQANSWGVIGFCLFSSWFVYESLVRAGQDQRIQIYASCLVACLRLAYLCVEHVAKEISPPMCLHAHCMHELGFEETKKIHVPCKLGLTANSANQSRHLVGLARLLAAYQSAPYVSIKPISRCWPGCLVPSPSELEHETNHA